MKIAILCRRYYPEIGGIETHIKEIAERLVKKHDLTVFTLVSDNGRVGNEVINDVPIRRFKSIRLSYSAEFPPASLLRDVEKFNPDIIHAHSAHTTIPYYASKVRSNSKLITTPHYIGDATTFFRRVLSMVYEPLLNSAFSRADRIVCGSSIEQDMLCHAFKIDQRKLRIVPNGVGGDLATIARRKGPQPELRILSVARFDLHHKRTDKLIQAFKIIEPRIGGKLVLVGSGPDKKEIIQLIRQLNLNEKVEVKSNLSREELIKEYANASIFVTASEQESFGIAVAEALAAKLKVIVPNSTALASFVNGGYALGIEVPITPERIAEAIIGCIQNNRQTTEYSPYTWDMASRDLESVYEEINERNT